MYMKSLNGIIQCVLMLIVSSGCTGLHTLSQVPVANSPDVMLNQNNFHVVKHISSELTCTYFLGIGGYSKKALEKNAVADMIRKANLTGAQTIVNIVAKTSRKLILVYEEVTMYVQGTVIEFDGPSVVTTRAVSNVDTEQASASNDDDVTRSEKSLYETQKMIEVRELYKAANLAKTVDQLDELKDKITEIRGLAPEPISDEFNKMLRDTLKYIQTKEAALLGILI